MNYFIKAKIINYEKKYFKKVKNKIFQFGVKKLIILSLLISTSKLDHLKK
jgi:hypothetical protein